MRVSIKRACALALSLAVSVHFALSCTDNKADDIRPVIYLKNTKVDYTSGSQFLNIQAEGEWSISVEGIGGNETDWVSVTPNSGNGSKSNVIVSYTENQTKYERGVNLILKTSSYSASIELYQNRASSVSDPQLSLSSTVIPVSGQVLKATVKASGKWKLYGEVPSGESPDWITVEPSEGEGDNSAVSVTVAANPSNSTRKATLYLSTVEGEVSVALQQDGKTSTVPSKTPQWMELPVISSTGKLTFITHDMKLGSVTTRNYSYAYDEQSLIALWVAYPLCAWNIGSGSRTNAWGYDPKLPASKQQFLDHGYKSGNAGFNVDRGHQIPSADRLNYSANVATFYFTNMTPQKSDFNQGIWAALENNVRSYARMSDTLYVVTGCTVSANGKYALDNDNKRVAVPTAYYKALLRYNRSSSQNGGYSACAFYFEHKSYNTSEPGKANALSIDELEKKTGVDFFANLPARIGDSAAAAVEAADPKSNSFWW